MNSKELMIICGVVIIGVLVVAAVVLVTNGNTPNVNNNLVAVEESNSSNSISQDNNYNSDPLAGMEGTDLYKATHSDLIIVGVVKTPNGYTMYGGSAEGDTWGYTNYDSQGNRLESFNNNKQGVSNLYNSACSSSENTVII